METLLECLRFLQNIGTKLTDNSSRKLYRFFPHKLYTNTKNIAEHMYDNLKNHSTSM